MTKLTGKTREEINRATKDWTLAQFQDAIYRLATLQPMYTIEEIAERRAISTQTIIKRIKEGVLKAHMPLRGQFRISQDALEEWDRNTALFFTPNDKSKK